MGTASMRFGQACLSMTVRPDQGTVEKEQADMKSVVKEQMQAPLPLTSTITLTQTSKPQP